MIGLEDARAAMAAAYARLEAAASLESDGRAAGSVDHALNMFAGTDVEGEAVLRQLGRIGPAQTDPTVAGAALLGFWLGWELRDRSES